MDTNHAPCYQSVAGLDSSHAVLEGVHREAARGVGIYSRPGSSGDGSLHFVPSQGAVIVPEGCPLADGIHTSGPASAALGYEIAGEGKGLFAKTRQSRQAGAGVTARVVRYELVGSEK